jgi:hypothetical protein
MKMLLRLGFLLLLLGGSGSLAAQSTGLQDKTTVQWEPDTLLFGEIHEGTILLDSFKVTNTGEYPYVIKSVKASCDCTVLRYPKEPLQPGQTATIRVEFDSAGKAGDALPGIIVYDNSRPNMRTIIYLSGYIIPRKKPNNPLKGE